MSRRRQSLPFNRYSLSPVRNRRRVITISPFWGVRWNLRRRILSTTACGPRPVAASCCWTGIWSGSSSSSIWPGCSAAIISSASTARWRRISSSSQSASPSCALPISGSTGTGPAKTSGSTSVSVTSAIPSALRSRVPEKITSCICVPRKDLALCSPSTQLTPSRMFDLPQPFGPTTTAMPVPGTVNSVRSQKLLNPRMCIFFSFSMFTPNEWGCARLRSGKRRRNSLAAPARELPLPDYRLSITDSKQPERQGQRRAGWFLQIWEAEILLLGECLESCAELRFYYENSRDFYTDGGAGSGWIFGAMDHSVCVSDSDWNGVCRQLVHGGDFADGPAGNQQAGRESGFGVAEGGKGGPPNLLAGQSGARDHGAGELRREALLEPLPRQKVQIAARHVDDAGRVLQHRQRRLVVRLGVMAGGEDHIRRAIPAGEGDADGRCRGEGGRNSGDDLEGHSRFGQGDRSE